MTARRIPRSPTGSTSGRCRWNIRNMCALQVPIPRPATCSITAARTGSAALRCATPASTTARLSRLRLAGNDPRHPCVRRVLRLELLVGPDGMDGLGDGDRGLGEAGRDQLQLPVERGDVAASPYSLQRGL